MRIKRFSETLEILKGNKLNKTPVLSFLADLEGNFNSISLVMGSLYDEIKEKRKPERRESGPTGEQSQESGPMEWGEGNTLFEEEKVREVSWGDSYNNIPHPYALHSM